jgi:hypothetical protein
MCNGISPPALQHVAQCEVLPRGDGPSPDERVGTQLRLGYQAPGLQNGSKPIADLVRWDHVTAVAALGVFLQSLQPVPCRRA